jgi:hypothetical protein
MREANLPENDIKIRKYGHAMGPMRDSRPWLVKNDSCYGHSLEGITSSTTLALQQYYAFVHHGIQSPEKCPIIFLNVCLTWAGKCSNGAAHCVVAGLRLLRASIVTSLHFARKTPS